MTGTSSPLSSSLWRALAYGLHPRIIWLSLLPLLLSLVVLGGLAWWGWSDAVTALASSLNTWPWLSTLLSWLNQWGVPGASSVLAAMLLLALVVPVVVISCLLVVATLMAPSVVRMVVARRFPDLASRHRAPWWASLGWSLGSTALALVVMLVSMPLWFIPPLGLILPPLIWGWLTYRVMAFDILAEHATPEERTLILREHRPSLLLMGVITGYLGAAPSMLWAMGALAVVLAPVMIVASLWIYTFVFVFSCLWFAHYLLEALQNLRTRPVDLPLTPPSSETALS
ncbi:MAG TPA: EI24 domain-containing protein [Aquabacterium sp.]|uniref:EI24 domain-containing protein n=1 Tax=Aquabacterium sp. TaxID=1872578 RepID=UPI002E37CD25|nr:EI24 domain-containing protein [Aquabacterium sp.]HEX5371196.1 EI24 domain-containing protein [Aquabacterium sp.]